MLGIDPGERRLGLAVTDELGLMAHPRPIMPSGPQAVEQIAALVAREKIEQVVVGLPIRTTGVEGPEAQAARQFAADLAGQVACPVVMWDERLTTVQAKSMLREQGRLQAGRKGGIDSLAAAVMLQAYLDRSRRRDQDKTVPDGKDGGING